MYGMVYTYIELNKFSSLSQNESHQYFLKLEYSGVVHYEQ